MDFVGVACQHESVPPGQPRYQFANRRVGPKNVLKSNAELGRRTAVVDRGATAANEFIAADLARLESFFEARVEDGGETGRLVEVAVLREPASGGKVIEVSDDVAEIEDQGLHSDVIGMFRRAARSLFGRPARRSKPDHDFG